METKFHLLPVGQHFEWEGKRYVKTTPLIANQIPDGGQRFVPRSALIKIAEGQPATTADADRTMPPLDRETLRSALDRYHQRCLSLLTPQGADTPVPAALHEAIEQLYRELLEELALHP